MVRNPDNPDGLDRNSMTANFDLHPPTANNPDDFGRNPTAKSHGDLDRNPTSAKSPDDIDQNPMTWFHDYQDAGNHLGCASRASDQPKILSRIPVQNYHVAPELFRNFHSFEQRMSLREQWKVFSKSLLHISQGILKKIPLVQYKESLVQIRDDNVRVQTRESHLHETNSSKLDQPPLKAFELASSLSVRASRSAYL